MCPSPNDPSVTRYNSYLFGCYGDEPNNGGDQCLGDRWWYHLNRRIYPMMVGDQPLKDESGNMTTEGFLEELERPEYNVAATSCASASPCNSGQPAERRVHLPGEELHRPSGAHRRTSSADGTDSYENTWPATA